MYTQDSVTTIVKDAASSDHILCWCVCVCVCVCGVCVCVCVCVCNHVLEGGSQGEFPPSCLIQ